MSRIVEIDGQKVCLDKHVKASECLLARFPGGKLDLSDYSRTHPSKGDMNFHDELNEAARNADRSWRAPESTRGRIPARSKYGWELKDYS